MALPEKILIVGTPNVGKSVIFNALTGRYATVSNYPGTTVDVFRGPCKICGNAYEIIDTPGMYSLVPVTEEERVSRTILLKEKARVVIHVIDGKNLERMLPFTLQLIDAGLPVVLVLNIMDEAERLDIKIDAAKLSKELGLPVILAAGALNRGIKELKDAIDSYEPSKASTFPLDSRIEKFVSDNTGLLKKNYGVAERLMLLWLLQEDPEVTALVKAKEPAVFKKLAAARKTLSGKYKDHMSYALALLRQKRATIISGKCELSPEKPRLLAEEALSRLTMHPFFGLVILVLVLLVVYLVVGVFGSKICVDYIENNIFGVYIIPPITRFVEAVFPWVAVQDLLVHDYGIFSLGIRYSFAIILPIVSLFFFMFAIIEDSGYLPRLAMLIDKIFKMMGLSGRAVIPMVLGLGCDTMATIVTRTLPSLRERVIATFLLALAIPCSAQLGLIMGLLSANIMMFLVWFGAIFLIFMVVGWLSAKILPGEAPVFFIEVPPLRFPKVKNLVIKTYTRLEWYLKEVIPMFILVSLLIWAGRLTGLFQLAMKALNYPVKWIGLPEKTSEAFLYGFFRRDYGAAGLRDMAGSLTHNQLVVALVTITLFLPCVAQFIVMVKERGIKTGLYISALVLVIAFASGYALNELLNILRITL